MVSNKQRQLKDGKFQANPIHNDTQQNLKNLTSSEKGDILLPGRLYTRCGSALGPQDALDLLGNKETIAVQREELKTGLDWDEWPLQKRLDWETFWTSKAEPFIKAVCVRHNDKRTADLEARLQRDPPAIAQLVALHSDLSKPHPCEWEEREKQLAKLRSRGVTWSRDEENDFHQYLDDINSFRKLKADSDYSTRLSSKEDIKKWYLS